MARQSASMAAHDIPNGQVETSWPKALCPCRRLEEVAFIGQAK